MFNSVDDDEMTKCVTVLAMIRCHNSHQIWRCIYATNCNGSGDCEIPRFVTVLAIVRCHKS